MTRARRELVHLETTPYYHCICRCVRRAFSPWRWGVREIALGDTTKKAEDTHNLIDSQPPGGYVLVHQPTGQGAPR